MTLARPTYRVVVTNITSGWTYTATQGDDSTLDDAVQLADGFNMRWQFAEGVTPGQLEPEQVTFGLVAPAGALDLPPAEVGDRIDVRLERPTAGAPILYMRFQGRLSDPTVSKAVRGALLELTATGLKATTAAQLLSMTNQPQVSPKGRLTAIATAAKLNLRAGGWTVLPGGQAVAREVVGASVAELIERTTTYDQNATPYVLRVSDGLMAVGPDNGDDVLPADLNLARAAAGDTTMHWIQPYSLVDDHPTTGSAPYQLVKAGLIATVNYLGADVDDGRQIPARLCDLDVPWRKDRADAVNQVAFVAGAGADGSDRTITIQHDDLVTKYGPSPLKVETDLSASDSRAGGVPLSKWLRSHTDARPQFSADGVVVNLDLAATDLELDLIAGRLYSPADGSAQTFPRRQYVVGITEEYAVPGRALTGILTGVTFAIAGGKMTATLDIRNEYPAAATIVDALTGAQLAASGALKDTTWSNAAVLHIDPELTGQDLALTRI